MKRLVSILIVGLVVALVSGALAADRIVLPKYPEFKIGFLNVNFIKPWPLGMDNAKKSIDFANQHGFAWIELRDPVASLTLAQCKELAAYAKAKDVEVAYGMNIGLLDPNFWEVFSRGLANAGVFEGPRTIRTAGPGLEFANEKKTHWTFAELQRAVEVANQAGNLAKMMGLQYVAENGVEALKGDGVGTFGTVELFGNANSNLGFQLDTGNFFIVSRVFAIPADALAFIDKYGSRMGYMHLKTAKDHKMQPVEGDSELDFAPIFAIAAKSKMLYIAFELDQVATFDEAMQNHLKSVVYLKEKFSK